MKPENPVSIRPSNSSPSGATPRSRNFRHGFPRSPKCPCVNGCMPASAALEGSGRPNSNQMEDSVRRKFSGFLQRQFWELSAVCLACHCVDGDVLTGVRSLVLLPVPLGVDLLACGGNLLGDALGTVVGHIRKTYR